MSSFAKLLRRYSTWSAKNPLIAIPISTGVILGSGDILCQFLEHHHADGQAQNDSIVNKRKVRPYDLWRCTRMGAYGTFFLGPVCALWYTLWLPACVPMRGPSLLPVVKKVFLDETLASWFYYLSFLYGMTLLEGKSHIDGVRKLKKDFWTCYKTDLMVWPFVQFGNFWFVPTHLQALVVSMVSVFWGCFLSSVQNN